MGNRAYALMTGIFILLLGIALVWVALWLRGPKKEQIPYVVVSQGSVYGLSRDARVFFRGVPVGSVQAIGFDPKSKQNVLVHIMVNSSTPVTDKTIATLKLQGVTGLSQLELENSGPGGQPLPSRAVAPARIPLRPSLLDRLGESGSEVLNRMDKLIAQLNSILNDKNRAHIAGILANLDSASNQLLRLEQNLNEATKNAPQLARHVDNTLSRLDGLIADLDELSHSLEHLADNASRLSLAGEAAGNTLARSTLPELNETLRHISRVSAQIEELARGLQKDPQRLLLGPRRPVAGPGEKGYTGEHTP